MKHKVKVKVLKTKIEKIQQNKVGKLIVDIFLMTIGALLIAIGTNLFLLPHRITTGGASGIATIFYYICNMPLGVTVLLINVPLFIIAIIKFGIKFIAKTLYTTIILSILLEVIKFESILRTQSTDLFTSCIFGGILVGLGLSVILRTGASSGGSDLLAQIIYQSTSIQSLSKILLMIEIVIISSIIVVFKDINLGLYSVVSLYISTKVIDILFEGIYYTKVVTIITQKEKEIVEGIIKELNRSATILESKGAHSNERNTTINCIVTRPELPILKKIVLGIDNKSIMYVTTINEAIGNGFKSVN